MKIVIINGQTHKGSTYHMGRILADKLAQEQSIISAELLGIMEFPKKTVNTKKSVKIKSQILKQHFKTKIFTINTNSN